MCALPIFDPAPGATGMDDLVRGVAAIASGVAAGTGRVTFVCAGPGDADLLTLRAMRALQAADVILHDARITDEVLELARREAKRVLVPNRAACPDGAGDLMVRLARDGRHVVRLGSGDPRMGRDRKSTRLN